MKYILALALILMSFVPLGLRAQSTYSQVYSILNSSSCGSSNSSCHGSNASSGLDFSQSQSDLYSSLIFGNPANSVSQQRGDKVVYPGDPYRSLLFRKINHDMAVNVDLGPGEGGLMPPSGPTLDPRQAELIRQWIIFGAPETNTVVSTSTIDAYYSGQGMESVTNPPLPPGPGEGFQIHIGPFLLEPGAENATELSGGQFMRYDAPIDSEVFITRIQSYSGWGQHHYTLLSTGNQQMPYGLADASPWFFTETKFLSSAQKSTDTLYLPEGTGISINPSNPLVANVHFFNPSASVLACDYYLNIYIDNIHSGLQEILFGDVSYVNNPDMGSFFIPNDGQPHTFEYAHEFSDPQETRFIWAIMAHSHGYTTENVIFKRNANGTKGEMIYDGGCPEGIPCSNSLFDEEHVPTRYFTDNLLELDMAEGLIQSATYVNNSDQDLEYGPFAEDSEMMVMGYYYLLDTAGVTLPTVSVDERAEDKLSVVVYPNPTNSNVWIKLAEHTNCEGLRILDPIGREVFQLTDASRIGELIEIDASNLESSGMYTLQLFSNNRISHRKFIKF